jgi:hypothetical protein
MKMRGQTAVEYLMTYGWAILIILIVAGVLAYYGIFAPAGFLGPTARGFGQIQVLNPWSVAASNGAISLNLANRVGGAVEIYNATLEIDNVIYTCDLTDTNITAGADAPVSAASCTTWPGGLSAGDTYTGALVIYYYYPAGTTTVFSTSGTITGTYS